MSSRRHTCAKSSIQSASSITCFSRFRTKASRAPSLGSPSSSTTSRITNRGALTVFRKQHSVGMTAFRNTDNDGLIRASADWISPGAIVSDDAVGEAHISNPPPADGQRVSLLDSDHLFFTLIVNNPAAARNWVWKKFFARAQPFLDEKYISSLDRQSRSDDHRRFWIHGSRAAMGHMRRYADQMNLITMIPRPDLASTRYALARPGSEYLVYQPHP